MVHGDAATAWALYDELIEKGLSPHEDTWDALFKRVKRNEGEEGEQERLLEILLYMRNNQIYPQHSLASTIKTWFERSVRAIKILRAKGKTVVDYASYFFKFDHYSLQWLHSHRHSKIH